MSPLVLCLVFQSAYAGLPADNIPKVDLRSAAQFTLVPATGRSNVPRATIRLPKGVTPGSRANLFMGPRGAFVSVTVNMAGQAVGPEFTRLSNLIKRRPDPRAIVSRPWVGVRFVRPLPTSTRVSERFTLMSPDTRWTMLTSWQSGDRQAEAEAKRLAYYVIRSMKLG